MAIFKVFSRKRALECITKGCKLLYTEPNRKKNWLSVFVFEDTEELHEILTSLQDKSK